MTDGEMTVDRLAGEGFLPFAEAAGRIGRVEGRGPLSPSTVFRWASKGVRLPDGTRLRLEAVRVGSRWVTTWPAVCRFLARQTSPAAPATTTPAARTPCERQRAAAKADERLRQLGF